MRRHVEEHGLQLTVLHCGNLPKRDIVYGREGRERQAHNWVQIVRGIGAAGVPSRPPPSRASGTSAPRPRRGAGGPA